MRVYQAIVKGLEGIGVEFAFGGAGENAAQLMLALKDSERIKGIITRHEQAASFMACGYAMYTDKLGFCFATAGPGAFNLFSGLGVAMSDSYPVLAVSGYASMEWKGRGSLNETSGVNRTPDSLKMFEATTKGSFLITEPNETCDILEQAVNLAFEGRPGPVHITVPENLTHHDQEVTNYRDIQLNVAPVTPDPGKVEAAAQALADALNDGKKVVVLAGFGAIRSHAEAEVKRFIERFQIPIVTTLDGKGVVSEGHPLCVGVFCDSGHASAWKAFRKADVVLAVGNAFNQHATFNYDESLFEDKVLIHVNISETEIDKAYNADHALVSDARLAMSALYEALDAKVGPRKLVDVDGQDWEQRHIVHLTDSLHPGELAQAIGRMLPPRAILLADAGAHLAWLGYYVELEQGQNFRKAGEFGPMAGHVNGAIGVKAAHPDRTVVVGCGDGCYNLSGFELMTAVEHNLPVIWIIYDDNEFKLIKAYQLSTYLDSGLVEFQNPDYAAYAQACGADGYRVESLDEFEAAFAQALRTGRPSVIDARITRWAIPHYSPSPDGVIAGIVKMAEARFRVLMSDDLATQPGTGTPDPSPADTAPSSRAPGTGWTEEYAGGDPQTERAEFLQLAHDMMAAQALGRRKASAHGVPHAAVRALHAKATLALDSAELRFVDDLPDDLRSGWAQPGAAYPTAVRFSNASNVAQPDYAPDLRGVALRVKVDDTEVHDLLMTNFPVSHARNARQFVEFALANAGTAGSRVSGQLRLVRLFGAAETVRMIKNITTGRKHQPGSVLTETYWSRGALAWGGSIAVRYLLRPAPGTPESSPSATDPSYLSTEAARRLADGPVTMELLVQRYRDPESTPIEDTSVEWTEQASPPELVARLTIPQGDVRAVEAQATARAVDELAFNPWNTTQDFRPLGNLNRARKDAYDASAAGRSATRWYTEIPKRNRIAGAGTRAIFSIVNQRVEWHRLPVRTSVLNLDAFRDVLREKNLIDTEVREAPPQARPVPESAPEDVRWVRQFDGRYNDLSDPAMGSVGAAFGRNMAPDYHPETFDDPNPVLVSQQLLRREHFIPATSLNILAAAWIQFQVHDWVNHARHPLGVDDVEVPMPYGQSWSSTPDGSPEQVMRIAGNISLGDGPDGTQRLFANSASHWWDASEIYGSDLTRANALREGAKLRLTDDGYLPEDTSGMEVTGFNESWWLGLSALHTVFAREHNVICDELRAHYRGWDDDRVFHTARLIVAALIAKIHTVEWTPAILATDALDLGMNANWYGPKPSDWVTRLGIWLTDTRAAVGIPKTMPDHHGVPFSLTEDFATVYRLHPLIPDDYAFHDHADGRLLNTATFPDIIGDKADNALRSLGISSVLYSLGIAHPGAITLHNYPRALQDFTRDGERIDLSVVDLVRTRRRGVPRYNDFRTALHKPRLRDFDQVSSDPASVQAMRELYRTVDDVDTMVGLFAEAPPEGFGFSDTAFRIFILMASRRLQSDRFLTVDFRPEVYSPLGMDWIANNGMTSVIARHCPELAPMMQRGKTAFAPWRVTLPPASPVSMKGH